MTVHIRFLWYLDSVNNVIDLTQNITTTEITSFAIFKHDKSGFKLMIKMVLYWLKYL